MVMVWVDMLSYLRLQKSRFRLGVKQRTRQRPKRPQALAGEDFSYIRSVFRSPRAIMTRWKGALNGIDIQDFDGLFWLRCGCPAAVDLSRRPVNSAPLRESQTPVVTQTLSVTLTSTPSPTMTSTPIPVKPANQRPPASATATVVLPVVLGTPFPTPDEPITAEKCIQAAGAGCFRLVGDLRGGSVGGWEAVVFSRVELGLKFTIPKPTGYLAGWT